MGILVGVTGYAQHGKDTVARRLVNSWGYTRMGFADSLKSLSRAIDPIVTDTGKHLNMVIREVGPERAKDNPEVRRFLQQLGTQARHWFGKDVWVEALERKMVEAGGPVVVSDVRFPNEANWIRRQSGVLIKVYRPFFDNGVDESHESEMYIPHLNEAYFLVNDGSIADLDRKVDSIMADLTEGFRR